MRPEIQITAEAYLLAAVCTLLLPAKWLIGWIIAVTIHEAGHLLALSALGIPVYSITVSPSGAGILTGCIPPHQELFCAAAGPICSLLLLILTPLFPAAAMIGLVQGLFNLLPVYPLDGGRMVRAMKRIILDSLPDRKIPCKE